MRSGKERRGFDRSAHVSKLQNPNRSHQTIPNDQSTSSKPTEELDRGCCAWELDFGACLNLVLGAWGFCLPLPARKVRQAARLDSHLRLARLTPETSDRQAQKGAPR